MSQADTLRLGAFGKTIKDTRFKQPLAAVWTRGDGRYGGARLFAGKMRDETRTESHASVAAVCRTLGLHPHRGGWTAVPTPTAAVRDFALAPHSIPR